MKKSIGIVGCGYRGKNLVRNFCELRSLYAICDVNEKRLKSFQDKYPDLVVVSNYKKLLKKPQIIAIVIATPAATHYSLAKEALLANKDVSVEKPIAMNYREGEELVSLAKEKDKILMVGHVLEYHPAVIKLRKTINILLNHLDSLKALKK